MESIFSTTGKKIIESLGFTNTLYAFDFDGTLAPIVENPEDAYASKATMDLLSELNRIAPVVIISGRSVSDLRTRIPSGVSNLIGNHGLEGLNPKKRYINQAEKTCLKWTKHLNKKWKSVVKDPGVRLENKMFSIALHYRKSRSKKNAKTEILNLISGLSPLPRIILGKSVMNLIPAGSPHKGIALLEAMSEIGSNCAFYIGDDDTDEDVFSLPDQRIVTTRVRLKRNSQAQFYMDNQKSVNRLLKKILTSRKCGNRE